jgi:hypothetical protein
MLRRRSPPARAVGGPALQDPRTGPTQPTELSGRRARTATAATLGPTCHLVPRSLTAPPDAEHPPPITSALSRRRGSDHAGHSTCVMSHAAHNARRGLSDRTPSRVRISRERANPQRESGPKPKQAPRCSEWVAGPRQLEAQRSAHVGHRREHLRIRRGCSPSPAPFLPMWTNVNDLQTATFARSPGRIPLSSGVWGRHVRTACEPTGPR